MKKQTYDLEERLLEYSVRIIKIVEQLPNTRTGNHVAGQLLRSGTSPYPNHGEAQAAESPKDFIHKLRISLKELRESQRWLKLIQRVPLIKKPELLDDILQETEELISACPKTPELHSFCHCEGGTTEAISLKIRGLLRRSFLTSRNDGSQLWLFGQALIKIFVASIKTAEKKQK